MHHVPDLQINRRRLSDIDAVRTQTINALRPLIVVWRSKPDGHIAESFVSQRPRKGQTRRAAKPHPKLDGRAVWTGRDPAGLALSIGK